MNVPAVVIILGLTGGTIELFGKYGDLKNSREVGQVTVDNFADSLRKVIEVRNSYQKPVVVANSMPFGSQAMVAQLASLAKETRTIFFNTPHQAAGAYAALAEYAMYIRGHR